MQKRRVQAFALAAVLAGSAMAANAARAADDESKWCRNGLFPSQQQDIGLARTVGASRIYFYNDAGTTDGCPRVDKSCRDRSYLITGQEVLVSKRVPGFACAYYPSKNGGSAGWIEEDRLAREAGRPDPHPPLSAWRGKWISDPNSISLSVSKGKLVGSGQAYYRTAETENDGEFDGTAAPQGNHVVFAAGSGQDDCRVSMVLVGPYLVVDDNNACGGMNVTFRGVYRRK